MARHVGGYFDEWKATLEDPEKLAPLRLLRQRPRTPPTRASRSPPSAARSGAVDGPASRSCSAPRIPVGAPVSATDASREAASTAVGDGLPARRARGRARRDRAGPRPGGRDLPHPRRPGLRARQPRPVRQASVLARGIVGTRGDVPFVASPMHKHAFDLRTGPCLDDEHGPACRRTTCRSWTAIVHVGDRGVTEAERASLPLDGLPVGVTAARKVEEQIALLERRGATVEWAPVLSIEPEPASTSRAAGGDRGGAGQPVDIFVATTGIGMRAWFDAAESVGHCSTSCSPRSAPPRSSPAARRASERCGAAGSASCGPRLRVLRGRARAPARAATSPGSASSSRSTASRSRWSAHALRRRGADVDVVTVYRVETRRGPGADVPRWST